MAGKTVADTASRTPPTGSPSAPVGTMPGGRAALPEGSLPKPFFGPQGDENRDPPGDQTPVQPAPVVQEEVPRRPAPADRR